jgi:ribosomal protein L24
MPKAGYLYQWKIKALEKIFPVHTSNISLFDTTSCKKQSKAKQSKAKQSKAKQNTKQNKTKHKTSDSSKLYELKVLN